MEESGDFSPEFLAFPMRIGRIILALLAPLLSFSPAVKAYTETPPSENKQTTRDRLSVLGLSDFLRLVAAPAAVTSQATVRAAHRPHAAPLAIFAPLPHPNPALLLLPPSTVASLQITARQSHRLLLRC
jgi:hypothetical protein